MYILYIKEKENVDGLSWGRACKTLPGSRKDLSKTN